MADLPDYPGAVRFDDWRFHSARSGAPVLTIAATHPSFDLARELLLSSTAQLGF
jgi:hypothetical protein